MSHHPRQQPITLPKPDIQYDKTNEQINRRTIEQTLQVLSRRLDVLEAVLEEQQAAISNPAGGATVDTEARTAIGSILTAMRNHGLIET